MPSTVGDLLMNHTRLTKLCNDSDTPVDDYEKLTQLKRLTISVHEDDSVMQQVLQLTNLISLDISYSSVTNASLQDLTKLSNLETLKVSGLDRQNNGIDWKLFVSLPKLRSLSDQMANFISRINILPEFTRLTSLSIIGQKSDPISSEVFFGLTNLQKLKYYGPLISVNFAPLTNVKKLKIFVTKDTEQILLPPHLKKLGIYLPASTDPIVNSVGFFESLCKAITLEELILSTQGTGIKDTIPPALAMFITSLTNLQRLKFLCEIDEEICRGLIELPSLRKLELCNVEDDWVDILKQAEQLVELWINSKWFDIELLQKEQLPFGVYKRF